MPPPPPSQRFRPAQRCLLSPLSLVPSGTALSPAVSFGDAWRRGSLETLLPLWWWGVEDAGWGLGWVERGFWGGDGQGLGGLELPQQPAVGLTSHVCLTEAGNLQWPAPQGQNRDPPGAAHCCYQ